MREFQEIMIELLSLANHKALFTFVDGLKPWAKLEVQLTNVWNMSKATVVVEWLVELKVLSDMMGIKWRECPSKIGQGSRKQQEV